MPRIGYTGPTMIAMSLDYRLASCLVALLLLLGSQGANAAEHLGFNPGRYHALVIGNNDYVHLPKLESAVRDAEAVAGLLKDEYGFKVRLLTNVGRADMVTALNQLRADLDQDDSLLIYYAGHGYLDKLAEAGFWLPVDAARDNEANWLSVSAISRNLKAMFARHVLVVADSCYSGTLTRNASIGVPVAAAKQAWYKRLAEARSRTALTSGGLEPVVDGGGGGHSVFAKAFLAALAGRDEILTGQALHGLISLPVALNAEQTPGYSDIRLTGHEGGDFLFVPKPRSGEAASVPLPPIQTAALEEKALARTKVLSARTKVKSARKTPSTVTAERAAPSRLETVLWRAIGDGGDGELLAAYLERFPNGVHAPEARAMRDGLKREASRRRPAPALERHVAIYRVKRNASLRAAPSGDGRRIAILKRGSRVLALGWVVGKKWLRVATKAKAKGYIHARVLEKASRASAGRWLGKGKGRKAGRE